MRPALHRRALVATALTLLLAATAAPAFGAGSPDGHWETLGEDGRVWVPTAPPTTTDLPAPDLGAYHNASETVDAWHALATARPDLVTVTTLGESVQGRPILLGSITAPGDASDRARVLLDGAHHGDEVIGSEVLTRFAQRVVAEFDANATMRAVLERVIVDVVPMVNPDGVALVPQCAYYADCRKNANGVDLNRNYDAHWGSGGSSGSPGNPTYRGPSPASEPETQAVTALLDSRDYAMYASLHSGAEVILWPWGWTSAAPPEEALFNELGNELSAITGAPHGQVSRVLYGVSGDSMDYAYGDADGWRAVGISPEVYRGAGNAYDWWPLFNPPESRLDAVVARWEAFAWHVATVAPLYAPASFTVPSDAALGPGEGTLTVTVDPPARRPLLDESTLTLAAGHALEVLSENPFTLPTTPGAHEATFTARPVRGGTFDATVTLDAGVQGTRVDAVTLHLAQVNATLTVDAPVVGSPDGNAFTLTVRAGPFERVTGNVTVTVDDARALASRVPFTVTPGAPFTLARAFNVSDLAFGAHDVIANVTFTADGAPGALVDRASFLVERPQVSVTKRFAPESVVGEPVLVTVFYESEGNAVARNVSVRETVPPGYALTTRDGPVPVPLDPVTRPFPEHVTVDADGTHFEWRFGDLAPGERRIVQYRIVPVVPGEHALPSAWTYTGEFESGSVEYAEAAAPVHAVTVP